MDRSTLIVDFDFDSKQLLNIVGYGILLVLAVKFCYIVSRNLLWYKCRLGVFGITYVAIIKISSTWWKGLSKTSEMLPKHFISKKFFGR